MSSTTDLARLQGRALSLKTQLERKQKEFDASKKALFDKYGIKTDTAAQKRLHKIDEEIDTLSGEYNDLLEAAAEALKKVSA